MSVLLCRMMKEIESTLLYGDLKSQTEKGDIVVTSSGTISLGCVETSLVGFVWAENKLFT